MSRLTRKQRDFRLAVFACALIALSLPFLKNALPWFPDFPCVFKNLTGLPCLLCGGTRAACAAVRGDWGYSFYLNPVAIPVMLALALAALIAICEIIGGRTFLHWGKWAGISLKLCPILALIFFLGWAVHIVSAVHLPKPELVDFSKLPARLLRDWLSNPFSDSPHSL